MIASRISNAPIGDIDSRRSRGRSDRRPSVPRPIYDNPLLQATTAFSIALGLGAIALTFGATSGVPLASLIGALCIAIVGVLVLFRSVAIRRIRQLTDSRLTLHYEVARASTYFSHLREMSSLITEATTRGAPADYTVRAVLEATNNLVSGARNESSRLALVRATPASFVVDYFAGEELLGIKAGKACPADRPLDDVLEELGQPNVRTWLKLGRSDYVLVLLTVTRATEFDLQLLHGLAGLLQMGVAASPKQSQEPTRLRAV